MEPEADSDKEEEPGHLLTAWLGELDTLKMVNNFLNWRTRNFKSRYYCSRAWTHSRPSTAQTTAL